MASWLSSLLSAASLKTYDVLVIGAGLAGLQAAYDCQRAGLTCIVLEARDRIGGKTLTSDRLPAEIREKHKFKQDLGAAWINDTNQSKIWDLAHQFGLTMIVQNTTGNVVVQDFDGSLTTFKYGEIPNYQQQEDTDACVSIRDLVESTSLSTLTASQRKDLDSISFETYLHQHTNNNAKAQATAKVWTHAMLGVDPSEVSALYYLEYCRAGGGLMTMRSDSKGGGQYLRIKEGVSSFAEHMARRLATGTVKLNSSVNKITQQSSGTVSVGIRNSGKYVTARKVIITIPTPIYKTIIFNPPLPASKAIYVNSTRYGHYVKFFVAFTRPFWRANGFCGLAQSFIGPVSVFRDTSLDESSTFCLTCFIGGSFARKWSALDDDEKLKSVLKQVSEVFNGGADLNDMFVGCLESPWMGEEWSGWGCPCPVTPSGVLYGYSNSDDDEDGLQALARPSGNLHFIGTETASIWRGYMDGAIRSGERGAAEVVAALKDEKARL